MTTIARRALTPSGGWKVDTPLLIASSPVRDDPPLANARSTKTIVAPMIRPLPWVSG